MLKQEPSNAELLEFIKDNVATRGDIKQAIEPLATKEELKTLATKEELKALATKEDLKPLATKEELKRMDRDLHHKLDGIGKQLTDLQTEKTANTAAHQRFNHRDRVFAGKLGVNLDHVDADA